MSFKAKLKYENQSMNLLSMRIGDARDIWRCPPDFTPVLSLPAEAGRGWSEVLTSVLHQVQQNSTMGKSSTTRGVPQKFCLGK